MGRHKTTRWAVPIQGVFSSPPFFYDIEDNVDSKCGGVFHVVPWMVKFKIHVPMHIFMAQSF